MVDQTPAWIAGSVAVFVALLAAGTAQWRLRQQLRHDRELRDLDEMRKVLDEASVVVAAATEALRKLVGRAVHAPPEAAKDGWEKHLHTNKAVEDYVTAANTFYEASEPVGAIYQRLVLRLGERHPICMTFLTLQETYLPFEVDEAVTNTTPRTDERWDLLGAVLDRNRDAYFTWMAASRQLVGVALESDRRHDRYAAPLRWESSSSWAERMRPFAVGPSDESGEDPPQTP